MEIKADKEGIEAIKQLCDIALKHGGLANHNPVAMILNSIKPMEQNDGSKNDAIESKSDTTD